MKSEYKRKDSTVLKVSGLMVFSCGPASLMLYLLRQPPLSVGGTDMLSTVISKGLVIMHALMKWVVQWLVTSAFVLRQTKTGTLTAKIGPHSGSY